MRHRDKQVRYDLVGWVLFLLCALLFLFAAIDDRDPILTLASLLFLGGCVVFLIPVLFPAASGKGAPRQSGKAPGLEKDKTP